MLESRQVESPLGCWTQSRWEPDRGDPLVGAVERIWDFDGVLAYGRERLFPNGLFEVVVQLDEPHRPLGGKPLPSFPPLCVDGLATVTSTIEGPSGRCRVLGISLHPRGAFGLLGGSLRELTDRSFDLCAVIGPDAVELAERLEAARHGQERVRAAERWVRERMARAEGVDPLVAAALRRIDWDGGAISISQLDELTGRSRSRFAARFRDQVGLAPKRYARIVRFRTAMELLAANSASLSAIAHASGYYDQAHLCAEFLEHAGLTPGDYAVAARYPDSHHLAEPA